MSISIIRARNSKKMFDLTTCYACGSCLPNGSPATSVSRDNDILMHSSSSSSSSSSKMNPSRCFLSPHLPMGRSGRSMKWSCLLTAVLAFVLGIGIGVFIPLYFMPPGALNILHSPTINSEPSADFQHLTLTPQPVILSQGAGGSFNSNSNNNNNNNVNKENDRTFYLNLDASNSDDSVSQRFPEFAQIQALRRDNVDNSLEGNGVSGGNSNNNNYGGGEGNPGTNGHPMYRRPSSNVKFVVPDSRILSLHPVQPEVPLPRFNRTETGESGREENGNPKEQLLDGVYWGPAVEKRLPKGFTDEEIRAWRRFVKSSVVSKIEEGCGRMQNRLLSLENGTRACCRYRHNFDQIQGEIFSFYLSQILKIRNLAPSALNIIQPQDQKWKAVRQQLNLAQWMDEKPVVLTRFIDSLTQAYIPFPFRDSNRRLHPVDLVLSSNLLEKVDLNELAQWSDLIVFDYLTANLDRMVNNLYNLQWNPSMMEAPAHNLAKDTTTGLLVFLDNESGLLHGYRLLDKYEQYHRVMLDSLCIFRRSTAEAVKRLRREKNVGHLLKTMFQNLEPTLTNYLPMIPDKSIKILNHRIDRVYDQITKCESLYS